MNGHPEGEALSAPGTITEFVTEQIRDRIVLGLLPPGSKLSVYRLADELGVSRVPLREAVRQLEAESLVDNLPRRGTVVRPLNIQDVRDAFEILDSIEVIAARRAAESSEESTIAAMRFHLEEMRVASQRPFEDVTREMMKAHRQFHFAFFSAAGEGVLQRHLRMLWNTCERYVINSYPDLERQAAAAREHADMVRQIEAKDPEGTVLVLREHLQASLSSALAYLGRSGVATAGAGR
ncbi:MAG: GntR family transcriptional regulator [Actinomycetota bacterium]|nr:GntR family transcriptional regulator [Actinomycetota bacterium]